MFVRHARNTVGSLRTFENAPLKAGYRKAADNKGAGAGTQQELAPP
jgi:hypothetical protein